MARIAVLIPNELLRAVAADLLARSGYEVVAVEQADVAVVDESVALDDAPSLARLRWVGVGRIPGVRALWAAGASCVIAKPFGADELVRAVRRMVEA